jgi:hypothetical protein
MNKKLAIERLEGRWIQTAAQNWYLVQDGKFVTTGGMICWLKRYTRLQLNAFWSGSRVDSPRDTAMIEMRERLDEQEANDCSRRENGLSFHTK